MKSKKTVTTILGFAFAAINAQATLTPTNQRGEKNIYFTSPAGVQEVCVIPKHYPDTKYSKKDLAKEQELCSYNFYDVDPSATPSQQGVALGAKLNSTNPAVNIFEIPQGQTKQSVEAKNGDVDGAKKLAKYKNSTSCSYAPSIIGYYHMSRILGDIAHVPVSVLRSMDIETHKDVAEKGVRFTSGVKGSELINSTWSSLLNSLNSGLASTKKDLLMSDDGRQSFGSLIVNPKHEAFYKELYNAGEDRAAAFRDRNAIFQLLSNPSPLNTIVPGQWNAANVQKLYAMRDVSEFILLDHLLDQQDRFGNISYQDRLAYVTTELDKKSGVQKLDLQIGKEDDYNEDKAKNEVVLDKAPLKIKAMVLKDNDCGVSKTNVVKQAGLLKHISHMSGSTYKKVFELQKSLPNNESFFTSNLYFTKQDFRELVANVNDAAQILKANCQSGSLKLDLNLEHYLTLGSIKTSSCDVP